MPIYCASQDCCCQCPWPCSRLPNTHRQVWLRFLWSHCPFTLDPVAHKVLSASLTMLKPLTVWITTNFGKVLKRWVKQPTLPISWETCMWVKKQQLELDMEELLLLFFSHSVMSNSLQPHGLQHTRLPCCSQSPGVCSIHAHWVHDAIQPSCPLLSPSPPAFNLSQYQGLFQWVSSLHQVAKVLELLLQHQSFQWIFRTDFL